MYKEVKGTGAMGFLSTKPTMIITTLQLSGSVNAGVFGAYTNVSPSQLAAAISTGSDTYANILREKEFAVNIPGADMVKSLKTLAAKLPPDKSELDEAGLSAREGAAIKTPGISECAACCEFAFEKEIPVGRHSLIIGRVLGGWIKEEFLDTDGKIDIFRARVLKDFKYPEPLYVLPGEVVRG